MTITKYGGLADDELLAHIEKARAASPVIEELARRLELHLAEKPGDALSLVSCPVCEATLKVEYDEDDHQFTLDYKV